MSLNNNCSPNAISEIRDDTLLEEDRLLDAVTDSFRKSVNATVPVDDYNGKFFMLETF